MKTQPLPLGYFVIKIDLCNTCTCTLHIISLTARSPIMLGPSSDPEKKDVEYVVKYVVKLETSRPSFVWRFSAYNPSENPLHEPCPDRAEYT